MVGRRLSGGGFCGEWRFQGQHRFQFAVLSSLVLVLSLISLGCSSENQTPEPAPTATIAFGNVEPAATQPNPDGMGGELLLTRFTDIIVSRADGGDLRVVTKVNEEMSLLDPVWSPDGNRIAYVRQRLFIPRRQENYGSSVLVMNRDGSGERIVSEFKVTGEFLRAPMWTPDGKALLISRSTPVRRNGQAGIDFVIERVDLETGASTIAVRDAFGAAISPDGRKLAYVAIDRQTDSQSLMVSDYDGKNPLVIASARQGFERFNPPRFAPDGSRILFAASGVFDIPVLPTPTPRRNQAPSDTVLAFNGLPWDLWTIRPDGSQLTRITQLGEDQPWASWSGDGNYVLLIGATGRFVMRPDGSDLKRVGDGFVHTEIDWR